MDDVGRWLLDLGLSEYADAFAAQGIDFELLRELSDADLQQCGVAKLGHRKKLLKAIAELAASPRPSAHDASDARTAVSPVSTPVDAARRQLTVMFCDLVGSTTLSTQLDPEDLQAVLRAYETAVAAAVAPYEGHVAQFLGDGVLVYFGYPRAHEDDAVRAVRAAQVVIAAVQRLRPYGDLELRTRIGIATGAVVVGQIGAGTPAAELSATGETPNLAARLQALAEPGEVVLSSETRLLLGTTFQLASLGPRVLKGIEKPVEPWRVIGEGEASSRFEALHPSELVQFIGRDAEVALLLQRWSMACEGEGQVVLLSGEAGIGKSRTGRMLLERLAGQPMRTWLLQCYPYFTRSSLYPVVQALERLVGSGSADSPQVRVGKVEASLTDLGIPQEAKCRGYLLELLRLPDGGRIPVAQPSQQRKVQTLQALVEMLEVLAGTVPLLMVVEDAQWIDPTTEEFLALALEHLRAAKALTLVICRPEYVPTWGAPVNLTRLILSRLGQKQSAELVEAVSAGRSLSPEVLNEIVRKTDGIPLFVEELTKTVLESGQLADLRPTPTATAEALAIPSTLRDSLMARIDRLDTGKEVAQVAAVIGREFSRRLLAAVMDISEQQLAAALDELVRAELVYRSGTPTEATYSFKHALVRDTAYGSMIRSQRRLRHGQIASALEKLEPATVAAHPELLAYHLQEAGRTEDALAYWTAAGDLAARRSANHEAVMHYQSALAQLAAAPVGNSRDIRAMELQPKLGMALLVTEGYNSQRAYESFFTARELARSLGQLDLYVTATSYASLALAFAGRCADAVRLFDGQSEVDLAGLKPRSRIGRLISLGVGTAYLGSNAAEAAAYLDDARRALEQIPAARRRQVGGNDSLIVVLVVQAELLAARGFLVQADLASKQTLDIAEHEDVDTDRVLGLRSMARRSLSKGDIEGATLYAGRMRELSARIGYTPMTGVALTYLGCARVAAGDFAAGLDAIRDGFETVQASAEVQDVIFSAWCSADALLTGGYVDEARDYLHSAQITQDATQLRVYASELLRLRGRIHQHDGEDVGAECVFREAVNTSRGQGTNLLLLRAATDLAVLLGRQGRAAEAASLLRPVYDSFTEGFDFADLVNARETLEALETTPKRERA